MKIYTNLYRKVLRPQVLRILNIGSPLELWAESCSLRPSILHIGAHLGQELDFYQECGFLDCCWVEAQPDIFAELEVIVGEQNAINCAIWSEISTLDFNVSNNSVSSSLLKLGENNPWAEVREVRKITVETKTLDDVISEFMERDLLPEKTFLVLDIQGAEIHALEGLDLFKNKIIGISCEVSVDPTYESGASRDAIYSKLKLLGFVPLAAFLDHRTKHGDQLFVRRKLVLRYPMIAILSLTREILLKIIKLKNRSQ